MNDAVTWTAIVAAIGALGTIITFWTRYSDRITKAEAAAAAAGNAAAAAGTTAAAAIAEVKANAAVAIAEAKQEAQAATRHAIELSDKLFKIEIWARDEFVRKASFETVVARLERGFSELRTDIGGRLDRMADRIEAKSGAGQ